MPEKWMSKDEDQFDEVEEVAPFSSGFLLVRDHGEDRQLDDWFVLKRRQQRLDLRVN